jgi:hypothetical protein
VILNVRNKVVYPCQGPCIIDTILMRVVVEARAKTASPSPLPFFSRLSNIGQQFIPG